VRINLKQLKKLKVVTISGAVLGNICGIVFETDGQTILQYEVCWCCLFGKKLLINRSQVVRFEEKKVVVDDSVWRVKSESEKVGNKKINVEPVVTIDG
jgi:uncharacterized protein YrrD